MALWGSFAFKTVQLFIPVWFQCRISGTRGDKRRMTAATPCIVLHSLSGSPFYCRFPRLYPEVSWEAAALVSARRFHGCWAVVMRSSDVTGGAKNPLLPTATAGKLLATIPAWFFRHWWCRTLPRHEILQLVNDHLFPRRRDENASHFPSESLLFLRGLKIWNSLLAGNAARKSPGEFRLMINLLPTVERLLEADGEKVGRNLLTRVRGAFPQTVGQVFPSLLVREHLFSSVLINRWAEATGTTWKRWALRFQHVSERLSCRY